MHVVLSSVVDIVSRTVGVMQCSEPNDIGGDYVQWIPGRYEKIPKY